MKDEVVFSSFTSFILWIFYDLLRLSRSFCWYSHWYSVGVDVVGQTARHYDAGSTAFLLASLGTVYPHHHRAGLHHALGQLSGGDPCLVVSPGVGNRYRHRLGAD